jgi:hypothetical protein
LCSNSPKLMVRRASLGSRWSGTLLDGNGRVVLKSSGIANAFEADSTARLCVRGGDCAARAIPMRQATEDLFRDVLPWRTFRWFYGQQHYSGSYWASTMSAHVIHESRLELARLLMADFDASVNHIVAQPFMMQTSIGGKIRRHIPDYLLLTDGGPVVVDVKPAELLDDPAVAETFRLDRDRVHRAGIPTRNPRSLPARRSREGVRGRHRRIGAADGGYTAARPVTGGRSASVTMPGLAATTAGTALVTGIAV